MGHPEDTKRSRRGRRDRAPGIRGQRLEELIREELTLLFESEVTDPKLQAVRITTVSLTPDGARARLFYSMNHPFDDRTSREVEAALRRASGFLRRELCDALSLKRTPELAFSPDLDFVLAGEAPDEEHS